MAFILDTNACIRYLINRNAGVVRRLAATDPREIQLCDIVKAELYYGAYNSQKPEENLALLEQFFGQFQSLAFDSVAARIHGRLRAELRATGMPIGPMDLLIAAIAIANDRTLVTHNT